MIQLFLVTLSLTLVGLNAFATNESRELRSIPEGSNITLPLAATILASGEKNIFKISQITTGKKQIDCSLDTGTSGSDRKIPAGTFGLQVSRIDNSYGAYVFFGTAQFNKNLVNVQFSCSVYPNGGTIYISEFREYVEASQGTLTIPGPKDF